MYYKEKLRANFSHFTRSWRLEFLSIALLCCLPLLSNLRNVELLVFVLCERQKSFRKMLDRRMKVECESSVSCENIIHNLKRSRKVEMKRKRFYQWYTKNVPSFWIVFKICEGVKHTHGMKKNAETQELTRLLENVVSWGDQSFQMENQHTRIEF